MDNSPTDSSLIVHIGPHKTGSTAVQRLLTEKTEQLQSIGIQYFNFPGMHGGAHQLADWISMNKFDQSEPNVEALNKLCGQVVISSENFSRLNTLQIGWLVSSLKFDEIIVVSFLRNPLERVLSLWQEKIKHGYRYTFLEYIAARLAHPYQCLDLNASVYLSAWASVLGKNSLKTHLYDRLDNVAATFFQQYCGIDPMIDRASYRVNTSFRPSKVEVYRALSGHQWHLSNCSDFDKDISYLSDELEEAVDITGDSYLRKFSLSMDSAILLSLERLLTSEYAFEEKWSDKIFEKREFEFVFYGNEVWLEQQELYEKLCELKTNIQQKFGRPKVDLRLKLP